MPYTRNDTAAVVARIERDLHHILERLRDEDPSLRSLVLTGGFARGEGLVIDGVPQNDYDLVAIHDVGPPVPYGKVKAQLERELGMHLDIAPVASWRLPWVAKSIFWYETGQRGRVLWGDDLLDRIPVQSVADIDGTEGLRLLVNRAAGLLLCSGSTSPDAQRLQAAKALLAAADSHLLATGEFPPTQTERWTRLEELRQAGALAPELLNRHAWTAWAFRYKTGEPDLQKADAGEAWRAAAAAILDAVPAALRHAGLATLEDYGRRDGVVDHLVYSSRSFGVRGARLFALHPTGRVRVATLRLLEASLDGQVRPQEARKAFGELARRSEEPLRMLAQLRGATLQ